MMKVILSQPEVAICGSTILDYWKSDVPEYCGGKFTIIGNGVQSLTCEENNNEKVPKITGYACGASLLIKRDVFLLLGGFDIRYYAYVEDLDISWRAWLAGYKVAYAPKAYCYHKYGSVGGN